MILSNRTKAQLERIAGVIEKAARLLAKPNGWTQHECARDKHGHPVNTNSRSATCFCSYGAAFRAADGNADLASDAMSIMAAGKGNMISWNDGLDTTQNDVVMAFEFGALLARDLAAQAAS